MKNETKFLNESALQSLINWTPHKNQRLILNSTAKNVVICAGRRFGKSALCGYLALKTLLEDNKSICLIAPTYDLTERVFTYLTGWIRLGFPSMKIQNRPYPSITTDWGSRLECKSAENPVGILGKTHDLTIVDECSRIPARIYEIYIYPTTHKSDARTIFISTPFGKNWFYEQYLKAQEAGGAFHFTSMDGVEVDQKIWDISKATLPKDVFSQEYEAVFLADAAQVFRNIRDCIQDCLSEPKPNHRYIMGLDVAKFNDFTALAIIDRDTHDVVCVDRWNKISYPLQTQRVADLARKYGAEVMIDAMNVGAAMGDDLRARGVNVTDFKAVGSISKDKDIKGNKEQAINKLASFLEERNIAIPPEPVWIGELESYGYILGDSGRPKYGAPEGYHDDCVTALYLATWMLYGKKKQENIKAYKAINSVPKTKRFQYL